MENLKRNFISTDSQVCINSFGDYFKIGDMVTHTGGIGIAEILSFRVDKNRNEVEALTNKGTCHIDFINHI